MILPADTKEGYSDDEEEYTSPTPVYFPSQRYDLYDPPSPSSHVTQPLLYTDDGDIELGPAPPYSSLYSTPLELKRTIPKRKRWLRWVVVAVALNILAFLIFTREPRRRWMHGHPFASDLPVTNDASRDGTPIACAELDPSAFKPFPSSSDQPDLPSPLDPQYGYRRSTNLSFVLPLDDPELFVHLYGPFAIGEVFYSTYETSSTKMPSNAIGKDRIGKGGYMHVIVEPVYVVSPDVADDQVATRANSPGWDALSASKICLMDPTQQNELSTTKDKRPPPFKPGSGLGIYTAHSETGHHTQGFAPLQFRLHIQLPASSDFPKPRSIYGLGSFILSSLAPPPSASLEVSSGTTDMFVDLPGVRLRKLDMIAGLGDVKVKALDAEEVAIRTTGDISGDVTASKTLLVKSPVGTIDLNVSLARPPHFADAHNGSTRAFTPLDLHVQASSGDATVRFGNWEEGCTLSQLVEAAVGNVKVYPHAMFEGPYVFGTSLGDITVDTPEDDIADPLGLGRSRSISLNKQDRIGQKEWKGEVKWEAATLEQRAASAQPEPQPPSGRGGSRRDKGMILRTSVGDIHVGF